MSGSFPIFDRVSRQLLEWMAPATALDLGAGSGKYGRLLAEAAPDCARTAVEIEADTAAGYGLQTLYGRVDVADAADWLDAHVEEEFDVVILGDCLQQMPKSRGLDLLNEVVYRSSWVLACLPEFVRQGTVGGLHSAVHRSVWSEQDMAWHDLFAWDNCRSMTLVLLRGYRAAPLSIDEIVQRLASTDVPILDYDGSTPVRPCRMRLHDRPRESAYRPR